MPEFAWTPASKINDLDGVLEEVMEYMSSIGVSEHIATKFGVHQETMKAHLEGPVKVLAEKWEQDDDPYLSDMNGMYTAGLMTGIMVERGRTKQQP